MDAITRKATKTIRDTFSALVLIDRKFFKKTRDTHSKEKTVCYNMTG